MTRSTRAGRWWIYVLRDPLTREVRYVGKSRSPKSRYWRHLKHAMLRKTHVQRWIGKLLDAGQRPVMDMIDAGCGSGDSAAERAWIAEYRRRGANLTNGTDGGDGGSGPMKESTKAMLIALSRGRVASPETRTRMRLAKLGKSQHPEWIERRREGLRWHAVSAETREKIAASKRGKPRDEETREKIAAALRGRPNPAASDTMKRLRLDEAAMAKRKNAHRTYLERERAKKEQMNNG